MIRMAFAILLMTSITGAAEPCAGFDWPAELLWRQEFVGVESASVTLTTPRPIRLFAFRVDRSAEGVSLVTNQGNGDRPLEIDGCYTTTFLERTACQLAINGAPFAPLRDAEDKPQNVSGLVVSDGVLVSPTEVKDEPDRAALVQRGRGLAIERPPIELDGVELAIGGFGIVLSDGGLYEDLDTPEAVLYQPHPRSAVGLSDEGRVLYVVVVDGRQPGVSEGVTLEELGKLFRLLGADDALNLDGGGTTSLAIETPDGSSRLVNTPINGGVLGRQRVAANHLGVYAKRLPTTAAADR